MKVLVSMFLFLSLSPAITFAQEQNLFSEMYVTAGIEGGYFTEIGEDEMQEVGADAVCLLGYETDGTFTIISPRGATLITPSFCDNSMSADDSFTIQSFLKGQGCDYMYPTDGNVISNGCG